MGHPGASHPLLLPGRCLLAPALLSAPAPHLDVQEAPQTTRSESQAPALAPLPVLAPPSQPSKPQPPPRCLRPTGECGQPDSSFHRPPPVQSHQLILSTLPQTILLTCPPRPVCSDALDWAGSPAGAPVTCSPHTASVTFPSVGRAPGHPCSRSEATAASPVSPSPLPP